MPGLYDELVQNEVNRAHNKFAQEKDELPVSNNLLVEARELDEAMTGKVSLAYAEKRVRYAMALMKEAKDTSNEGVTIANQENAIRTLLAAAQDMAKGLKMKRTAGAIQTAWDKVTDEAVS